MKTLRWLPPALGVGHTCWVSGIVYVRERPNRDTCIVQGCASRPKHLKSTVIRRGFISGVDAGRRARLLVTPQVTFHHQHSIDPAEKLSVVVKEVQSLYKTFSEDPVFGVQYTLEGQAPKLQDLKVPRQMDDVEIVDTDEANHDALAAYYADGSNKDHDRKAVLDPYLGLAVEQLYGDVTLEQLWSVL